MSTKVTKLVKRYNRLRNSTIPCQVPCPKCKKQTKDQRYTKHFKNLSSVDWHVSTSHKGEYWVKDFKLAITQLAKVLEEVRS